MDTKVALISNAEEYSDTVGIDIPVTNPTDKFLQLSVVLENHSLSGRKAFVLRPKQTVLYRIKFSPAVVGTSDGSVIFLSEMVGEFWYALKLIVEKPLPTTLPEIECELGKWVRLYIPLFNPTCETLELEIDNSNPSNFSAETDPKQPLIVAPHSTTEVPVQFCPSALGRGKHKASITFKCSQLKEWIFYLSGTGLLPQLMEPTSISTCIDQHSSVIISFRNPAPENVLVDVELTDTGALFHQVDEQAIDKIFAETLQKQEANSSKSEKFVTKTRQKQQENTDSGIALAPKGKLDIPVLFIPDTMKMYEALVVIHVMRENGENWPYEDSAELNKDLKSITVAENGGIRGIRWIYPVHGIPEAPRQKLVSAVIRCRARHRVEKRVEVLLTGVVPGATAMPAARNSAVVDTNKPANFQDEVQVTDASESDTPDALQQCHVPEAPVPNDCAVVHTANL
nr:PREDICTED: putative uncharacterized protein CXorf30 [Apteryx mantelli mantelli]